MEGVSISSRNEILMSSGLGSSAAAIVAGALGANEMLGKPMKQGDLLKLAADLEGHPDNVSPALLGGLVISTQADDKIIWRRHEIPEWTIVIVKPQLEWTTKMARAVLPKSVSRADAIFNIGRSVLVVEALQSGDLELLRTAMDDRIHQSYRLRHISGGAAAYKTARNFGAAALSGAGPSIILFTVPDRAEDARTQIASVFEERGIQAKSLVTKPVNTGAYRVES